ncbi:unnamed protein product [Camellia sinensis]
MVCRLNLENVNHVVLRNPGHAKWEDGSICLDILICGAFCPALSTTAYHARGFPPSGIMQPGGHYLQ